MLVLLPPSETKRPGGVGVPLGFDSLAYPKLTARRRVLARALVSLAKHPSAAMLALKLGRTQEAEVARNRSLLTSPTMPAIDRYTGVLYDALDAVTLSPAARAFAGECLMVHSALFGPVGALDHIPAYRLSHDSRLPELPLKKHWASGVAAVLAQSEGLVLDLRSEAYVALGPVAAGPNTFFLRIVTVGTDGRRRALNHFNKKSKGEFTRALLEHGEHFADVAELLVWAADAGFQLNPGAPGELDLTVEPHLPAR